MLRMATQMHSKGARISQLGVLLSERLTGAALLLIVLGMVGCNASDAAPIDNTHDRSDTPPRNSTPAADAAPPSTPDAGPEEAAPQQPRLVESEVFGRLADPEVAIALCTIAGANAASNPEECQQAKDDCEANAMSLSADAGALLGGIPIPGDVAPFSDCSATLEQLDPCFADLLDIIVKSAAEMSCDAPPDAGGLMIAPQDLLAAPSCLVVLIQCPDLVQTLLGALAP
jgi:hypothetical protein